MKKILALSAIATVIIIGIWLLVNRSSEEKVREAARIAEEEERKKQEEQSATKAPEILYLGKVEGDDEGETAGLVTILSLQGHNFISFNEEFKVADCSDATVYLGNKNAYDPETRIGLMTSNEKSQNYEIPSGIEIDKFSEVWVICESSSKPLGHVKLIKNGSQDINQ